MEKTLTPKARDNAPEVETRGTDRKKKSLKAKALCYENGRIKV